MNQQSDLPRHRVNPWGKKLLKLALIIGLAVFWVLISSSPAIAH